MNRIAPRIDPSPDCLQTKPTRVKHSLQICRIGTSKMGQKTLPCFCHKKKIKVGTGSQVGGGLGGIKPPISLLTTSSFSLSGSGHFLPPALYHLLIITTSHSFQLTFGRYILNNQLLLKFEYCKKKRITILFPGFLVPPYLGAVVLLLQRGNKLTVQSVDSPVST